MECLCLVQLANRILPQERHPARHRPVQPSSASRSWTADSAARRQFGSSGFRAILQAAKARGELNADTDISMGIDQLAGPLMYRRLFAGRNLGERYVETVVDGLLRMHAISANGPDSYLS